MTLCVLAATDSKIIQSGYSRFRGVPGVGSYVNIECRHVKMSRWIEYACGVKSETITLDRRVDLRCAWTALLSEWILGCISNDPSFHQKHPGDLDGSDGSDGSSYPLTENHTLPVAHIPPLLCGDVYAPSEQHVCYTLHSGCSYAEAVYTTPGDV